MNKLRIMTTVVCALMAVAASQSGAETEVKVGAKELSLIRNGIARAVIVIPRPPDNYGAQPAEGLNRGALKAFLKEQDKTDRPYNELTKNPAEDLSRILELMSGAKIPIVFDGEEVERGTIEIHIGRTAESVKRNPDAPKGFDKRARRELLGEEGYIIRVDTDSIYLLGNEDGVYFGTAYAVYDFLYRLGVRWYFPGQWGEVVPEKKDVTIPRWTVSSKPDFKARDVWMSGWVKCTNEEKEEYRQWRLRNRMNPRGPILPSARDGSIVHLLPHKEYAETHPEFYAMSKLGVQPHWGDHKPRHVMLCLSNPDAVNECIKNLKDAFAGKREMRGIDDLGFAFSPPDGAPFCYCPGCKEKSYNFMYPEFVHTVPMLSEPYYDLACKLARAVPDKIIGVMAYSTREVPPQGIGKFPPQCHGQVCAHLE